MSRSDAIRSALLAAAGRLRRRRELAAEVAALEADEQDRFEDRHLVLCRRCSDRLIEPHPRLYRQVPRFAPEPGRMDPCLGCRYARALRCESPLLKANGGAGLPVRFPQPMHAFVDGTRGGRRTGWQETIYPGPATCEGRTP